ncbi:MAG: outer membrane protein [Candidatus Eiseniibacteriota bacterium]
MNVALVTGALINLNVERRWVHMLKFERTARQVRVRVLWIAAGITALLLIAAASGARAVEIVPSVGLTRTVDSDEANSNFGLALRGDIAGPVLQAELAASYRSQDYAGGDITARMVPVTASLLLRPIPMIHADAGAGWYHTKYEYPNVPGSPSDETIQQFGVHVGGGLEVPLAPKAALDLTGRYIFLENQESQLIPQSFDPDFWSMALGLALRL